MRNGVVRRRRVVHLADGRFALASDEKENALTGFKSVCIGSSIDA